MAPNSNTAQFFSLLAKYHIEVAVEVPVSCRRMWDGEGESSWTHHADFG